MQSFDIGSALLHGLSNARLEATATKMKVLNRQSFGWTFIYSVDWSSLALSVPLILATALLAALPASQLAFRTPPAMILRER